MIWLHSFHPFYVSVTEIEQNPQTKTVQVSVRIFYDDFEKALTKQYKSQVNILKPVDRKKLDLLIADYISNHLKIKANAKTLSLKYLGYEIEEEAAWCYFETEKQAEVQSITVMNNILFEQHTTQINMIHAIVNGKRKSSKLNNPANSVSFQF
ncbi:MAG: hypothetical protein EOO89_19550 [Pedobacter sp.]|nr:MAG: hypothetical protein EOO89_19550 [Pedobacter sp.]